MRGLRLVGGGIATGAVLLSAACGGGGGGGLGLADSHTAKVTITPASGGQNVKPDAPIQVAVTEGKIDDVSVQPAAGTAPAATSQPTATNAAAGAPVTGTLDAAHTGWKSSGYLTPGASYTVTVAAESTSGKKSTVSSTFQVLTPKSPLTIVDVTPDRKGEQVGVGMPIIVTFNHTVKNRAAVEKQLKVTATKGDTGAWRWVTDSQVIFRTKTYWKAHQTVTLDANLTGVPAGAGSYGVAETKKTIQIGAAQISKVNIAGGSMVVTHDGKVARTFHISGGSGETEEYTTTSGIHLAMDKENPVTMTSPGRKPGDPGYYKVTEHWAVRISNSGEYVHESDPYSPSHGCIHAATSDAEWFYDSSQRGDPVVVSGTPRSLPWDNGWGYWQLSYSQWQQGSALNQ